MPVCFHDTPQEFLWQDPDTRKMAGDTPCQMVARRKGKANSLRDAEEDQARVQGD